MMHGHEKSDPAIVAKKPANNAGQPAAERVERRAGTEGNARASKAPGAEPGKRVTGAGARTASRKAKEEGAVHRALPPHQLRNAPYRVLRAEAGRGCGRRRVTWQDYEADLDRRIEDLSDRVHRGAYRAQPSRRRYIPKPDG